MDKTAIRNFAIWARKKLIEDTEKEAALYGITEKGIETPLNSGKDQYFNVPGRARTVVISAKPSTKGSGWLAVSQRPPKAGTTKTATTLSWKKSPIPGSTVSLPSVSWK